MKTAVSRFIVFAMLALVVLCTLPGCAGFVWTDTDDYCNGGYGGANYGTTGPNIGTLLGLNDLGPRSDVVIVNQSHNFHASIGGRFGPTHFDRNSISTYRERDHGSGTQLDWWSPSRSSHRPY